MSNPETSFQNPIGHRTANRYRQKPALERRPDTVMFVERTAGGTLVKRLRAQERDFYKFSSKKVKYVERNGTQVQAMLTSPDPWGQALCERESCLQ